MMMFRKAALLVSAMALAACSSQSGSAQAADTLSGKDAHGQAWTITLNPDVPKSDLPSTSDMKLMSFDAGAYVKQKCVDAWRQSICEVYAQTDPNGSLSGYLAIEGDGNSWGFNTDTVKTPRGPQSGECMLGGVIEVTEGQPTSDFSGRSQFEANDAIGMIYLKRVGNNLKVNDERWNYCYEDRHIDDVYVLIGTFTRTLDPSRWPKL